MPALSIHPVLGARYLLRALLRECTYLPDPAARIYAHSHVLRRFREFHPLCGDDIAKCSFSPLRLRGALKKGRKALNFMRRVNEGELASLQHLLLQTYGRTGRRRRELMHDLLMPDPISEWEALELWQSKRRATLDYPRSISSIPKTVYESPKIDRHPCVYGISPRYWKLHSLVVSQAQDTHPIEHKRTRLKNIYLEVPLTNIWTRSFPRKRQRNMVIRWYAFILNKILPPLPEYQWNRLRDLTSGSRKWRASKYRRSGIPGHMSPYDVVRLANIGGIAGERFLSLVCREHLLSEKGSKSEKLSRLSVTAEVRSQSADRSLAFNPAAADVLIDLLRDGLETNLLPKRLPGKRRGQNITPRLMRRLWAKVYSHCPFHYWDDARQTGTMRWGSWANLQITPQACVHDASLFEGVDHIGKVISRY